jgi:MFS family permease
LKEGLLYVKNFKPIRAILTLLALVSLIGIPYTVLMPVFATKILHGGPRMMGLLTCSVGLGALGGAVYLAIRKTVVGITRALVISSLVFGLALIAFSLSRSVVLSLMVLPIAGACMIIEMAGSNTLLQTLAEDHHRGRVMAMFTMCFMGTVPIGSLICGLLSNYVGAPATVAIGGAMCIVASFLFHRARPAMRPLVLPIYIRRGILPEVAQGIRAATTATDEGTG